MGKLDSTCTAPPEGRRGQTWTPDPAAAAPVPLVKVKTTNTNTDWTKKEYSHVIGSRIYD
jgi:hypothetical protein